MLCNLSIRDLAYDLRYGHDIVALDAVSTVLKGDDDDSNPYKLR